MMVVLKHASTETTDGNLPQAVWQPARVCIPLFRSHRHSRLPPAADAGGAHRPFLPRRGEHASEWGPPCLLVLDVGACILSRGGAPMRWKVTLVAEVESGQSIEHDIAAVARDERITPATLG